MYLGIRAQSAKRGSMTRLRESLVHAEYYAAHGQAVIDDQRAHFAKLTRDGNDAQEAKQLLVLFEAAQDTLIAYRDCLRRLVANIESDCPQWGCGTRTASG
jgi:hypothetical protein